MGHGPEVDKAPEGVQASRDLGAQNQGVGHTNSVGDTAEPFGSFPTLAQERKHEGF